MIVSVGRWIDTPTPVAEGLLALASAITGKDLYADYGRTLEDLGLADLSTDEMKDMLHNGL